MAVGAMMKRWRSALAALGLFAGLLAPGPSAFGQAESGAIPRRPIPYAQLIRPNRPKPKPAAAVSKPKKKTAPPTGSARPAVSPARGPTSAPVAPARVQPSPPRPAAATPGPSASPITVGPPAPPPPRRNGARLAPGEAIAPAELEAFVDGVLREGMAADHVAGVSVSIVQNGQVALEKGYGEAAIGTGGRAGRAVDPRATLFRLGSASTLLTAIETAKAVEQGRIKLDLPANVYLAPALRLPDDDVKRPVLMRHLLTQTAGFEERALGRLYRADPARLQQLGATLAGARPRRVYAPGELASLSSYGTSLLGAALANTGRRPWNELMEAEVFGPLGLGHTSFREPYPARAGLPAPLAPALAAGLAQSYRWTGRGFEPLPFEYAQGYAPAASASTTASDMGRLMLVLLNGGGVDTARLYGPGAAQLLRTPMQKTALGLSGWPGGLVGSTLPGGFGASGFSGGTLASRAALTTAPDLKLGVFVAANTDTAGPLTQSLAARIVERFYAPPRPGLRTGDPALAKNAGAFAGRYLSTRRARNGLEKVVERLTRAVQVRVSPDGRLALTMDGRTRLWSPEFPGLGATPTRFRAADGEEALVFSLEGGRIAGFTPASNTERYTRVGWFLHPGALALGAAAVGAAALLSLVGLFLRAGRELRRTDAQAIGGGLQAGVGVLWLAAFACAFVWRWLTPGPASLMFGWPGGWLIAASSLALAAFLGSLLSAVQLFEIWRSDRRRVGWKRGRQLRHTTTAVIFVLYGVLLTLWGALTPWSA